MFIFVFFDLCAIQHLRRSLSEVLPISLLDAHVHYIAIVLTSEAVYPILQTFLFLEVPDIY